MSDYFGKEVPKLGFGLMRLPHKGLGTDVEQVKKMVDLFLDAGFTYFDTAFVYPGSENAIRKALVERYPRDAYTLATKINAFILAPTESAAKKQFDTSLKRTGAGYFDYYLLHAFMENNYSRYDKPKWILSSFRLIMPTGRILPSPREPITKLQESSANPSLSWNR